MLVELFFQFTRFDRDEYYKIFKPCLNEYMKHGGGVFLENSMVFQEFSNYSNSYRPSMGEMVLSPYNLKHSPEPLVIADLAPSAVCLIACVALEDINFRVWLKAQLCEFRSPLMPHSAQFADRLFDSVFDARHAVQHLRGMKSCDRRTLLPMMARLKCVTIFNALTDLDLDVNGSTGCFNMLGNAVAAGQDDTIHMLLSRGANGALAISGFLTAAMDFTGTRSTSLLRLLVEHSRPSDIEPKRDPLISIITPGRKMRVRNHILELLIKKGAFDHRRLKGHCRDCDLRHSYIYLSIYHDRPYILDCLLQHGGCAKAQIGHLFQCRMCRMSISYPEHLKSCSTSWTWLTHSVRFGSAACASILLKHGADVTALDGTGRSAVGLAVSNASAQHLRMVEVCFGGVCTHRVSADEDKKVLAVVERAFNARLRGQISMKEYLTVNYEQDTPLLMSHDKKMIASASPSISLRLLIFILTPDQMKYLWVRVEPFYRQLLQLWFLSFFDGLTIRFFYVLSYILLPFLVLNDSVRIQKPIPRPSRGTLSAVAVLLLALIWGSAQTLAS